MAALVLVPAYADEAPVFPNCHAKPTNYYPDSAIANDQTGAVLVADDK